MNWVAVKEAEHYQVADAAHEDAGAHVVEPDLDDVELNPDLEVDSVDRTIKTFIAELMTSFNC